MRYTQPEVLSTSTAVEAIQNNDSHNDGKMQLITPDNGTGAVNFSTTGAYEADE